MCTKDVMCNGQKNMNEFKEKKRNSVFEAVDLACDRIVPGHEWISEFSVFMHFFDFSSKLDIDLFAVQCFVQWTLL